MSNRKLSAGDTIEAKCTRCRKTLNHTIVAMIEEKVVRVQCNTCSGIHNFREGVERKSSAEAPAVKRSTALPRKAKVDPEEVALQEWESVKTEVERVEAMAYDMNRSYRLKNVINHPVFGLGMVKQLMPHKIEVVFRSGTKLLRCG